jgi:hypothetical protein
MIAARNAAKLEQNGLLHGRYILQTNEFGRATKQPN